MGVTGIDTEIGLFDGDFFVCQKIERCTVDVDVVMTVAVMSNDDHVVFRGFKGPEEASLHWSMKATERLVRMVLSIVSVVILVITAGNDAHVRGVHFFGNFIERLNFDDLGFILAQHAFVV